MKGKRNKYFLVFCLPVFLLVFPLRTPAQNPDINILRSLNVNRNIALDPVFSGFSWSVNPVGIGIPVSTLGWGYLAKDSVAKRNGFIMNESVVLASVLSAGLKYTVNRPRPFATYPFIEPVVHEGSPSFPSGHTTAAFAAAASLSLCCPKWYVIVPSYLWAAAAGYSRMHLGVHYPSDVLAGALIGTGSAYLCYKTFNWVNRKVCRMLGKK